MAALRLVQLTPAQRRLVEALIRAKEKAAPEIQRPGAAMEARQRHAERPPAA
jgi:hypothetical protein